MREPLPARMVPAGSSSTLLPPRICSYLIEQARAVANDLAVFVEMAPCQSRALHQSREKYEDHLGILSSMLKYHLVQSSLYPEDVSLSLDGCAELPASFQDEWARATKMRRAPLKPPSAAAAAAVAKSKTPTAFDDYRQSATRAYLRAQSEGKFLRAAASQLASNQSWCHAKPLRHGAFEVYLVVHARQPERARVELLFSKLYSRCWPKCANVKARVGKAVEAEMRRKDDEHTLELAHGLSVAAEVRAALARLWNAESSAATAFRAMRGLDAEETVAPPTAATPPSASSAAADAARPFAAPATASDPPLAKELASGKLLATDGLARLRGVERDLAAAAETAAEETAAEETAAEETAAEERGAEETAAEERGAEEREEAIEADTLAAVETMATVGMAATEEAAAENDATEKAKAEKAKAGEAKAAAAKAKAAKAAAEAVLAEAAAAEAAAAAMTAEEKAAAAKEAEEKEAAEEAAKYKAAAKKRLADKATKAKAEAEAKAAEEARAAEAAAAAKAAQEAAQALAAEQAEDDYEDDYEDDVDDFEPEADAEALSHGSRRNITWSIA